MLRERLSFLVFEAMGIAAPRNAFTRLTVNREYWGLFNLVEPVSKPFLEARLGEKNGTLFDYEWQSPYDFSWLGPATARYVPLPFQPETNEEKPDVAAGLVAFIRAINEEPDATFLAAMAGRLDVDRFLTHLAVENAIAEGDGILGDQGLNNFYLYEYGAKNRFVFIPWDKDSTFRSHAWPLYRNLEENELTRRLTADPAKRRVYADAVVRAAESFVNPRWLTPQLETAYQQIRSAALGDSRKPYTNAQFEGGVSGVRGVIAARAGRPRPEVGHAGALSGEGTSGGPPPVAAGGGLRNRAGIADAAHASHVARYRGGRAGPADGHDDPRALPAARGRWGHCRVVHRLGHRGPRPLGVRADDGRVRLRDWARRPARGRDRAPRPRRALLVPGLLRRRSPRHLGRGGRLLVPRPGDRRLPPGGVRGQRPRQPWAGVVA
jgi:hypothetical protein